ncbi:A disintegrin and metalloproteinase with thrombospondin motifs 9 [Aplysia californica]|uniref:A disintegrin and metalloproteinase with thrombospondin motifs 9 n=1 Tax=Aplysia californica TaxID=6500 RepID=A0ABM0ZWS2_APLCA|nr:A disintegrin and metalloproteinase with thrombospondin motifs 9 [Aplysia californica]
MRTVLMALVLLWWCHLAIILPVILGQQAQANWEREQGLPEDHRVTHWSEARSRLQSDAYRTHPANKQRLSHGILSPSSISRWENSAGASLGSHRLSINRNSSDAISERNRSAILKSEAGEAFSIVDGPLWDSSNRTTEHLNYVTQSEADTGVSSNLLSNEGSNDSIKTTRHHRRHARKHRHNIHRFLGGAEEAKDYSRTSRVSEEDKNDDETQTRPILLTVNASDVLDREITLVLSPVTEFFSPGFVIQRVQGNVTWLEEVKEDVMACYFSGYVLESRAGSNVAISLCNGVRGVIQIGVEKYYVEPARNSSAEHGVEASVSSNINTSSSSSSSSSSGPPFLSSLQHQRYVITRFPAKNFQSSSSCSITQNFKHHRLKQWLDDIAPSTSYVNSSLYKHSSRGESERSQSVHGGHRGQRRRKRSVGVSRKHTVETLVVADAKMYQYHGEDTEQYVLTLMSIVRSVYKDPSIQNFINVAVAKLIIFETTWEMPFEVSQNAASTLKEFCLWQNSVNDFTPKSEKHHDTAILLTREDICRAPGKCDTLGLAELGTICDTIRSCSIIEDNGISAAFTVAHELGHVFNLPHDDDKRCTQLLRDDEENSFHVMAPTLDYNASPWDWSRCSAELMTEFLESGLAVCLQDGLRVKKWTNTLKSFKEPGWMYTVNKQCQLIFGEGYVVCPYTNNPICRRLWCTNENDKHTGCRTKHMPWADGTRCSAERVCVEGECVPTPDPKPKVVNGGWGLWRAYGPCSRTCGGGVKMKYRECKNPVPENGGRYCLGPRVRYKSCNIKACPVDSRDFREVQCDSEEMKRKFRFRDLPQNTTWKPKYTGVHMKDACKLYCSAGNSSTYFQFSKKVIDGTKCGPFTDDVCVNGQCWHVGCDNRLGSTVKRDRCGICGGDNFTCRTVTGMFNNAIYGYNYVGTIPAGATEIDIRQYGQVRHVKDDDNYLALQNSEDKYILNGDYTVRTEPWKIKVRGALIEYTGSEEHVERINTTMMIEESINIFVLSVGKLNPPNITYSYMVSVRQNVQWKNQGWTKCSAICNGERRGKIQCIRENDNLIVSNKRCKGLQKPSRLTERCNLDCKVSWRIFSKEECPKRCGTGMRRQLVHCIKQTGYKNAQIINDKECRAVYGAKPDEFVPCQGRCLPTFWSYTDWSTCSRSCGNGIQERQAKCVDESGKELENSECDDKDKNTSRHCSLGPCAEWTTGHWQGCSVTCGSGHKLRKVWCMRNGEKVDDSVCSKKKPATQKECHLKSCPEWYTGGWGPCSVTCGKGISMRAVKCRVSGSFQEDSVCDAGMRPQDKRSCFIGACPTTPPQTTVRLNTVPNAAYWRYGSWTECSATCGPGNKHRYVSCMDYNNNHINDSECSHLAQPTKMETCMLKPCGDWRQGEWSDCTVTCGEGIQTRFVVCTFNQQRQDDRFCDVTSRPETEIRCNRGTCLSADELSVAVITSNKVVGTSHWRIGSWTHCSSTCGTGWERRHVMCRDERGASDECDKSQKPDEFRTCDSGECPSWLTEDWGNCTAKDCGMDGVQTRVVACRLSTGEVLANSNCDSRDRPSDTQQCKGKCGGKGGTEVRAEAKTTARGVTNRSTWHRGQWSTCSVTCGQGVRSRVVTCVDDAGVEVGYEHCKKKKPRNMKRCSKGPCPKWYPGKWSRCSVTCGEGERMRQVQCRDKRHKLVDPGMCAHHTKPQMVTQCSRKECSLYSWKIGTWSECSRTCGFGRKHRSVTCVDTAGSRVSSHLCDTDRKPKVKRRCSEFPCPSIWNTGAWSECSASCGEGRQTRTVVCQAVTKEGWILPGEVHYGCRPEERPRHTRYCNYGDCGARNHWTVGPWGECSVPCGHGKQRRQVICVDKNGERTKRRFCFPLYRPITRRPCYNGHCYAKSCQEFKEMTTIRRDGDYQLKVGNQLVKIYCKDMRSKRPKEYISLTQGPGENFSETFDKRLRRPGTCPNGGARPPQECSACRRKSYEQAGIATFSKVRIDLETLTIDTSDGEFSDIRRGKFVQFGTGGDCYSSSNCPQGRFSISLVDTGFIVSVNTTWSLHGNRASQRIWRLRDGQIIRGVCGGYCGVCSPDPKVGLKLELLR